MMKPQLMALALVVCVAATVTGYKVQRARHADATTVAPVIDLDRWSFTGLDGQPQRLAAWAGKIRVVNFWATWCAPCLREIPAFMTLQERYATAGVQFIGIAMDELSNVNTFATEHGVNYPLLVGQDDIIALMHSLGNDIGVLPYTAVIGHDGRVRLTHQGEWSESAADAALRRML